MLKSICLHEVISTNNYSEYQLRPATTRHNIIHSVRATRAHYIRFYLVEIWNFINSIVVKSQRLKFFEIFNIFWNKFNFIKRGVNGAEAGHGDFKIQS